MKFNIEVIDEVGTELGKISVSLNQGVTVIIQGRRIHIDIKEEEHG